MKTDHILFIASGAFHVACRRTCCSELQGHLADPGRIEGAHARSTCSRILTEPEANLIRWASSACAATEGVTLEFTDAAIDAVADAAEAVNGALENIGARRLQTVLEKVVEEISFSAADRSGETIVIDLPTTCAAKVGELSKNADLVSTLHPVGRSRSPAVCSHVRSPKAHSGADRRSATVEQSHVSPYCSGV